MKVKVMICETTKKKQVFDIEIDDNTPKADIDRMAEDKACKMYANNEIKIDDSALIINKLDISAV